MKTNVLYYGDNLDILRRYVPDESIDLVYLDPPFNSNRDYNVIFRDESGRKSDAQLLAFEDTWHWGPAAEETYAFLTNSSLHGGHVPSSVSEIVGAMRAGIGKNQMLAYLVEMTTRLVQLHRALKPTGTLYLHCDPTASHYLKLVLDAVFSPTNFLNEITWKRSTSHGNVVRNYGSLTDAILVFTKSQKYTWNQQFAPFAKDYIEAKFTGRDPDGRRWQSVSLRNPGPRPNLRYPFTAKNGVTYQPHPNGWAWEEERLRRADEEGRLQYPRVASGQLRLKMYLDESQGIRLQNIWDDIPAVNSQAKERLGWETQKPVALLERIIATSSNPGDIVLDPFCGCGTALIAAQTLGRKWIGIDITYLSIAVMRARLKKSFGLDDVPVIGQPTEVEGARQLAVSPQGRYQFQWWALALIDADPVGGVQKKGADQGIDGIITFTDAGGALESVLVSVKSGHVNVSMIRDLKGTIERDKAAIGVFLTLEPATEPMKREAAVAGFYHSALWGRDYPRIQILTIEALLGGQKPNLPPFVTPTYRQAQRLKAGAAGQQGELFGLPEPTGTDVDVEGDPLDVEP
jgi:site-specific DNA-methyltransferase (adenine-specific)